ncbi:MAG: hypothetical protein AAFY02_07735 [Pseudomonadota bacterium]
MLRLTAAGEAAYAPLEAETKARIAALLERLPDGERDRLLAALEAVQAILEPKR